MASSQKIAIVGAGPVGSLAALYAAQRGYEVEVYELRPDLRNPGTIPLNFTRSINLALSERGINALRQAGHHGLLKHVMAATVPMRGRMIHGRSQLGELYQHAQDYDARGRSIHAIDRAELNKRLLNILDAMPNVQLLFNHKLTGADFRSRKAWFEVRDKTSPSSGRPAEIEVGFDLMIGADGAHSAVRYHMMKFSRMDYQQEYIDTLWCEFLIPPKSGAEAYSDERFHISPNHLHIWPGKDFMFIAIPSEDGSFTCTLFLPSRDFAELEAEPSTLPAFFDHHFPGVTDLISAEDLVTSFETNPHLPLISIKCRPYHFEASGVIIGDAAHAMVPFYGQGMNAGMEDVRVLFETIDRYANHRESETIKEGTETVPLIPSQRHRALAEYSAMRAPDAYAINDLALQNYVEMRSSVLSFRYRLRKFLEEAMSLYFPSFGWETKYARVSFGNEGYSRVVHQSERQGKILFRGLVVLLSSPVVVAGAMFVLNKYRRSTRSIEANLRASQISEIVFDLADSPLYEKAGRPGPEETISMPSIQNLANTCSHLQNASRARLGITSIPNNKFNLHLSLALHRSGFLSHVYRAGSQPPTLEEMVTQKPELVTTANVSKMRLWLGLKYWDSKPVLSRANMISKPSRLMTADTKELGNLARGFPTKLKGGVLPGLNLGECMFVATSQGVLEAREALSRKLGGLLLCRVS